MKQLFLSDRHTSGQVSMEYLLVIGVSLLFIMPMTIVFYNQSFSLRDGIHAAQLEKIGQEIIDSAEEMYYLGEPSQKRLVVFLPEEVDAITIYSQEIAFNYSIQGGSFIYYAFSELPLNMSGTLSAHTGRREVLVQATTTGILVTG